MLNENKINTIRVIDTVSRVEKLQAEHWVVVLTNYPMNTIHILSEIAFYHAFSYICSSRTHTRIALFKYRNGTEKCRFWLRSVLLFDQQNKRTNI